MDAPDAFSRLEPGTSLMSVTPARLSGAQVPVASAPPGPLGVDVRGDLGLGGRDAASLEALIAGRPGVGIFLTKAWLSAFFAEPPSGFEPSLALFRDAGGLRGVAPIAVRRTRAHVRVALLGGGAGSDRVDLLAARGFEAACADAFLTWLQEAFGRRAFVLELRDVPADSPLWGAAYRANAERGLRLAVQPREVHTLPYLDLREPSPSGTPAAKGSGSLDKHRRWLERRGRLRIEILREPGDVLDAFECLVRLLHARWRDRADPSALDHPGALRFHRHALPLLLAEGHLRMIRLSVDGRPVAVFYGLALGGWWGYYLAGYDRDWAGRIHLGRITLAAAIELAGQEGAAEFDFLKGAERVKYHWPVRERATVDADVYSAEPGAQLDRAARAAREAAAALARSARHLWDAFGRSFGSAP
jgi:CelD/BcsL family acetyltransferase involved in cellulose biosynthesis